MIFIYLTYTYLVIGIVYAVYFAFWRVDKLDASAKGSNRRFRLLLLPGCTLLWPVLLFKKFPQPGKHDQAA